MRIVCKYRAIKVRSFGNSYPVLSRKAGSKGEKAGIRLASPAPFAGFTLKLGNFHWSHNAPQGGHPTEILLLNSLKQGYVVALRSGELTFFRQDAPGAED